MTHPDEGPETADAAWLDAYRERAKLVGTTRLTRDQEEALWVDAATKWDDRPPRPVANVRAAGVAVRFVAGTLGLLAVFILLAYLILGGSK